MTSMVPMVRPFVFNTSATTFLIATFGTVDYEDLQAMNAGTGAEQWLISFTTELRKKLPSPYISSVLFLRFERE